MNQKQRDRVAELVEVLQGIHTEIEELKDTEGDKLENMPEGFVEKKDKIGEGIDYLEGAEMNLSDAIADLENLTEV